MTALLLGFPQKMPASAAPTGQTQNVRLRALPFLLSKEKVDLCWIGAFWLGWVGFFAMCSHFLNTWLFLSHFSRSTYILSWNWKIRLYFKCFGDFECLGSSVS